MASMQLGPSSGGEPIDSSVFKEALNAGPHLSKTAIYKNNAK